MSRIIATTILAFTLLALVVVPRASAQSPVSEPTCTQTVRITSATSSAVLITHNGTSAIRVCYYSLSLGLNATTTAQIVWGTGTTCGSSQVSMSPQLAIGGTVTAINNVVTAGNGWAFIDENPTRGVSDLCIIVSGSSPHAWGTVRYGTF